ncbi:MAG: hypothetical protein GX433_05415 [Deltaproteobacteria bacterium]|nr:hypothetical protein [Deltaproteobacteria bacterium]
MAEHEGTGRQQLFTKLSRAIEEWENSPYYLQDDELFDLEGFLVDENAEDVKVELEEIYGTPLNRKFWSSFLAYQRLKRAREEIKAQDALQEEKRKRYLEALEEEKKADQNRLKEWFHQQRRHRIRVIKGGRKDDPSES